MRKRNALPALVCALLIMTVVPPSAQMVSSTLVISQIYGGGGNAGATLKNDFIELYNAGNTSINLAGWSVQYSSSTGTAWQLTSLTGVLDPGAYYLVQEAQGTGGTVDLPAPNATGSIAMAATAGKIALVNSVTPLTGSCPLGGAVVDFVGYGTGTNCFEGSGVAPAPGNTTADLRLGSSATDTDNNNLDFTTGAPNPRNAAQPPPPPPVSATIHDIQGAGSLSPLAGKAVVTEGIVTALKSNGFFLQVPDAQIDSNPNTSEGIFVFTSSAPPAAAIVGNLVRVTGLVSEFRGDPNSPPLTEIGGPDVVVLSSGMTFPTPVTLTASDTPTNGTPEQLERFEGMRVRVASLTTIAPTLGNVSEPNATGSSSGVFYAVITGIPRPYRETGIDVFDVLPAGSPCCIPRFDTNPEKLRIDSDAQPGAARLDLTSNVIVMNVTGVLDYGFRAYTINPDPGPAPAVTPNMSAIPVPAPAPNQLTLASFNMERFFDTFDDPSVGDPILTATAFSNRLNKASLAVRNVMRSPDVIGVEEIENLATLQSIASKINADAVAAGAPNPNYQGYLFEGNDPGGIDVGVLVKGSSVQVVSVTQEGKLATYTNPANNQQDLLNDRPPIVLKAKIQSMDFIVIVNHLRSLLDLSDPTDGPRVRAKRSAQAEYLAMLIQGIQSADPGQKVISVGDYNAYQFNDGYVDVIGTVKGVPASANNVVLAGSDFVNPDLINLIDTLSSDPYSYSFDGNAQAIDHILITQNLYSQFAQLAYARNDADFPEIYRSDPSRPERISDHDMPVAYFTIANEGPIARNDVFEVSQGGSLVVPPPGVLANDSDIDSPVLTASLVIGPANGTLVLDSGGGFTYTPSSGFAGVDVFTYRASDGQQTADAIVTITVGIADSADPLCALAAVLPGPPTQIRLSVSDAQSGLKNIAVIAADNVTLNVPAVSSGSTSPVLVTAVKISQTQSATVGLRITDVSDNATLCNTILHTLTRRIGRPYPTTFTEPRERHILRIINGRPGTRLVRIWVNGRNFDNVSNLRDGAVRIVDLAPAMHSGTNTIAVEAVGGTLAATADIVISRP